MIQAIVQSQRGITLVGGAPVALRDLKLALRRAPDLVAVDGGADRLLRAGLTPAAAIGDFDSISDQAKAVLGQARLHHIAEQETTDFDKALRSVAAPLVLGLGFVGARVDHGLAVLNALVRQADRPCVLIGPQDLVFHVPAELRLRLVPGDRLSLFPMAAVQGRSRGLHWPIDGLAFAPDGMIGTSNRVSAPEVTLQMAGPGMLMMLPRNRLDAVLRALVPGAGRGPSAARGE